MGPVEEPIRLLYIDDDQGLSRLVQKDLERNGFQVTCAPDGDTGLALLREHAFDVVALDHFMPVREGLDVLPEIRALPDAPPVVYVTGAQEGRIAVAALRAGAADYVIKDVDEGFIALLRAALEAAVQQDRLRRAKEAAELEVRAARDRAEALLREVNHRVGNSLQLVSSFISLQSKALTDEVARDALRVTQARIEAVAQVHRRLYTSANVEHVALHDYLTGLVDELRQTFAAERSAQAEIELEVQPVLVSTDRAVSLGVIAAELVTNAVKYAYPESSGPIRVRLAADGASRAVLVVEDEGVGMGDGAPKGTGLGARILHAMATSLNTRVEYDPAHGGVRATLRFDC